MCVISLLAGILLPVLGKVKRQAKVLLGINNQGQIVLAVTQFAMDHNGRYPESVATIGSGRNWNWQEPTMLVSSQSRDAKSPRSVSFYLRTYIKNAKIMFCPNGPRKYKSLQKMWEAGDDWVHPKWGGKTPFFGTYCFYWNYMGFMEGREGPFRGPRSQFGSRKRQSSVLVSDYFGLGHWRNANTYGGNWQAYGSCEKFNNARTTLGTDVSSAFWSRLKTDSVNLKTLQVRLHAGFTDGHVESYTPSEVVMMRVSMRPDGGVAYPWGPGPGGFYVPRIALH